MRDADERMTDAGPAGGVHSRLPKFGSRARRQQLAGCHSRRQLAGDRCGCTARRMRDAGERMTDAGSSAMCKRDCGSRAVGSTDSPTACLLAAIGAAVGESGWSDASEQMTVDSPAGGGQRDCQTLAVMPTGIRLAICRSQAAGWRRSVPQDAAGLLPACGLTGERMTDAGPPAVVNDCHNVAVAPTGRQARRDETQHASACVMPAGRRHRHQEPAGRPAGRVGRVSCGR